MDDSPWDDDYSAVRDAEWNKLSSEFTNTGYREGITAGKEAALQEGFDVGFAQTGAPLGREVGRARGMVSAVLAILSTQEEVLFPRELEDEAREILGRLNEVRLSDVAPPDTEAETHLREEHEMEALEDMLAGLGGGGRGAQRPTLGDVRVLAGRGEEIRGIINK